MAAIVPEVFYRFRSIDKLLGKKELERLEIRLASPPELNDPMEGYKDVLFRGDDVLWENLLRHYILALVATTINSIALGDAPSDVPDIRATLTADDLPTDSFRALYHEACDEFFKQPGLTSLSTTLGEMKRPLRREGATLLLSFVHSRALPILFSVMKKAGVLSSNVAELPPAVGPLDRLLSTFATAGDDGEFETVAFAANRVRDEQSLRALIQVESLNANRARSLRWLLYTFPEQYVQSVIDGLVYPSWHTACFSANCTDASMWGGYGDQHRGVALIFRPQHEDGRPFIPLVGTNGTSFVVGKPLQYTRGPIQGFLEKVAYSERAPEVDFFQSLGNLNAKKLARAWHTNPAGRRSKLVDWILTDHSAWQKTYWEGFRRSATTKLVDWKHEEEYRLFVADTLKLRSGAEHRLVKYDLSSLVGIVFGMRVSEVHKLQVIKHVITLCQRANRNDFAFHQMAYSATRGRLVRI